MKHSTKLLAAFLATVFLAGLFAPTAMAQNPAMRQSKFTIDEVSPLSSPVVPDVESKATSVSWTYTVDPGGQIGFVESTGAVLEWTQPTCTDSQIFVTGPLTQTIPVEGTSESITVEDSTTFQVSATTEAPGEVTLRCTFEGKVLQVGNSISESSSSNLDLTFSVDYYGLIQAKSASRLKEAGPQKTISYDIEVTNFGNARTNVAFSLGQEETGSWQPIVPEPLILESKVSGLGGDVQTASFQISTPFKNGWNNDERTFKVILTPTSAKTAKEGGNPVEVNVLARVRGVYVPSLEPFALVGAVIGAGLLARLRRDD